MQSVRALACPASLKGVLSARDAAAALAEGLRAWATVDELPVADGGEGTLDVLHFALGGEWREAEVSDAFGRPRRARWLQLPRGQAVVEAAEAIPLDPERLDPLAASSRGLGQLIGAVGTPRELLVGLGGTANVDGGAGLLEVLDALPAPTTVLCDVATTLYDAPRLFGPQKGATPTQVRELERRLRARPELAPHLPRFPVRGRRAASVQRSPRSAPSWCGVRPGCSTSSVSTRPRTTSSSGAREPWTPRRHAARRRAKSLDDAVSRECAVSSSAGVSSSRLKASRRSRCPAIRTAHARTSSGSVYGLAASTRRASSSILPCAASSLPTQSV